MALPTANLDDGMVAPGTPAPYGSGSTIVNGTLGSPSTAAKLSTPNINPLSQINSSGYLSGLTASQHTMPDFGSSTNPNLRNGSMADMVYTDDFGSGTNQSNQYSVGSTAKGSNIQNLLSSQGMKEINPNSTFQLDGDGYWNEMLVNPSSTGGTTGGALSNTSGGVDLNDPKSINTPAYQAALAAKIAEQGKKDYIEDDGKLVNPMDPNLNKGTTGGALSQVSNNPTALTSSADILGKVNTNTGSSSVAAPGTGKTAGGASATATQGGTNPLVTSTADTVTATPSWYTDFLNQISTQGQNAAQNAQYVGATDLQNKGFDLASDKSGAYQGALDSASKYLNQVGDSNLYKAVGDVGEQNIRRNLAPQATAGLVGSGQFGSSRGATALGDTIANAELGITQAQAQAMQQDMQNRLAAGQALTNLGTATGALNTQDISNLLTSGAQKQTIEQNKQLFPMQQLANESALLRGYTIPTSTSTSTTAPATSGQMGLSNLANILGLAGTAGTAFGKNSGLSQYLFGKDAVLDSSGKVVTPAVKGALAQLFSSSSSGDQTNTDTRKPVSMDSTEPIVDMKGETLTPRGDGTYTKEVTDFDGSTSTITVDSDGNPV